MGMNMGKNMGKEGAGNGGAGARAANATAAPAGLTMPSRSTTGPFGPLLVVGLPLILLYLRTASWDIGIIDSGELAVVCARLGIAHPTGYPLYTLLGRLMVLIWPGTPIAAVTILSVFAAAGAAVVTAVLARALLRRGLVECPAPVALCLSWGAGLWLGTSLVFWNQATGNEVYSLHLVFVALLLLLGQRLFDRDAEGRDLLLLAWVGGLAFCHHLSVAFLAPALIWAFARCVTRSGVLTHREARNQKTPHSFVLTGSGVLLAAVLAALLAWSIQLYLPIRSARGPLLDWGGTTTWGRFWRHVLAGQYRVWLFESGHLWWDNVALYLRSLPARYSWPVLALCLPGGHALARRDLKLTVYYGLAFLVTVVWAASYSIHDLEPYFLPADLVLSLLAVLGLGKVLLALSRTGHPALSARILPWIAGGAVVILAALQVGLHFREADRRGDHVIRLHAETILRSLPERAILLTRHWDAFISASLYLQEVEGLRRDITVVDTELLRRPWYYPQLRRWDPELLAPMEDRVSAFLAQAVLFEQGRKYDPAVIQPTYLAVIEGIAQHHRPQRPTCFTPEEEGTFLKNCAPVPEGLFITLKDDAKDSPRLDPPDVRALRAAGFSADNAIHLQVAEEWGRMASMRVRYLEAMERKTEAEPWRAALNDLRALMPAQGAGPERYSEEHR
jgi:hypothetical protein